MDLAKANQDVKKFGTEVVTAMKQQLQKLDVKSSGNLFNSINYKFKVAAGEIVLKFVSADYGQFVNDGRKAGSFVPPSALAKWASINGIPKQAVYAINRKIWKYGIKPKPWIKPAFMDRKQDLTNAIVRNYETEVVKAFKTELTGKKLSS